MPRARGKYKTYGLERLVEALRKIRQGEFSIRRASIAYSIPKTTLLDKIRGRSPIITTQGPSPVLTEAEEERLAEWLKNMSRIGYGQTRQQLKMMVKKILDEDGRRNPFTNNIPGHDWFRRFKARHPCLSERVGECLGKERAMLTVEKIERWFVELERYLKEEDGHIEILNDPTRLFNCDESGFPLNGKTMKVLALKGCKTVYQLTNSDKSQITVLACMNAAGLYIPPMLIFPGQRFKYNPLRGTPDDWFLGRSESGWIDQEVFYEWIANHFVPTVKKSGIPFPVILFLDGHRSHINLETANFCALNGVILYCFPAHASHILQPCDLSLFKSVKTSWKTEVQHWQIENPGQNVTKQNFAGIFYRAWVKSATTSIAANGFKAAGLYPFTKGFDRDKLEPSTIFNTKLNVLIQPEVTAPSQSDKESLNQTVTSLLANQSETQLDNPPLGLSGGESGDCLLSSAIDQESSRGHAQPTEEANKGAGLARKALETTFTPEKVWLYEKRFREGFDVETDELYNTWKKLKVQEVEEQKQRAQPTTPVAEKSPSKRNIITSNYISPYLEKHLRYPKAPQSNRRKTLTRELPKAISGMRYRQYLEEKQTAKEKIERRKQQNKVQREAKRVEKQRLQKEKETRLQGIAEKRQQAAKLPILVKKKPPVRRQLLTDTVVSFSLEEPVTYPQPPTSPQPPIFPQPHPQPLTYHQPPESQDIPEDPEPHLPKAVSAKQSKEEEERRRERCRERREAKKLEEEWKREMKESYKRPRKGKNVEDAAVSSEQVNPSEGDEWTNIDENLCDVCQQAYQNDDEDWVGCEWCPRWFHKGCTDIANIQGMNEDEINLVDWYCHHCM